MELLKIVPEDKELDKVEEIKIWSGLRSRPDDMRGYILCASSTGSLQQVFVSENLS